MTDRVRRAFVPESPSPGSRVSLDPDEAHHVARVLRLRVRDELAVFDGRGGEWDARVDEVSRDRVSLVVGGPRSGDPEPSLRVTLFQSFVRPERVEWVLQKGTEIGVASFRLVPAERSDAPAPSPSRFDRYRRILLEASKQSGRRRIPDIDLGAFESPPEGVTAIVLDAAPDAAPLGGVLSGVSTLSVWIGIGPEGGFTDDELAACAALGWRRASLGPRTLRTETAGAVAAAIVLHLRGDLGAASGRP